MEIIIVVPRVESNKVKTTQVQQQKKSANSAGNYTVKSGDTVYKLYKAFNFKSEQEFRDYVKLSGTGVLQKGSTINLPSVKLETTISAIAKKYNCSVADILALNPQIKDPSRLQKGALVFVPVRPFVSKKQSVEPVKQKESAEQSSKPAPQRTPVAPPEQPKETYSAKDIAAELKEAGSAWTWNSLNSKKFKAALAKINKDNVKDVIKEYDLISKKESLINMICSEVTSSEESRKTAVMDIYHKLAEAAGKKAATPDVEAAFKAELDKEFDEMGFVSTKKLDPIVKSLINGVYPDWIPRTKASGDTNIIVNGEKSDFTVESLHKDWQKNAKNWNRPVKRPMPSVDVNGNVIADVQVFEPAVKKGSLSGHTIIVNSGHGGAMCGPDNSLTFDPGASNAYTVTKKVGKRIVETEHKSKFHGNGGKALEEWVVNRQFADELTQQLTKQGAKVVYISGSVYVAPEAIEQYRKNADMVISLHANSHKSSDGVIIIPTTSKGGNPDSEDAEFASVIQNNLESRATFEGRTTVRTQGLAALRDARGKAYSGPDIMIETGNLKDETDVANLTNSKYRTSMVSGITDSVVEFLNPSKKKVVRTNNTKPVEPNKFVTVRENQPHKVKAGENLSVIAKKYGVQIYGLKSVNNMTSDRLSVGQVLNIPPTIMAKNVNSLGDVASAVGLSEDYIKNLKRIEDDSKLGENQFHTKMYTDKNGNLTIGIGHLIKPNEISKYKNETLTKPEVCTLLAQDILDRAENLKVILGADTYNNLPKPLKDAVMDFTFSRGESTIKNHPGFVDALKKGDYAKAISLMNIDYSIVKDKNGKSKKVYLTGMVKRRLFEIHTASQIYKGKLPKTVKQTVQTLYERGLAHMQTEFSDAQQRANIKVGYDKYIKELFGDDVTLK